MKYTFTLFAFVSLFGSVYGQDYFSKVYYNPELAGISAGSLAAGHDSSMVFCGKTSMDNGYMQAVGFDGTILWQKACVTTDNIYPRVEFKHVQTSADSSYLFSGFMYNGATSHHEALLVKTNQNGDTLWTTALELSGESFIMGQRMAIHSDNSVSVLISPIEGPYIVLATLDADGQLLSSNRYNFPVNVFAESFTRLSDSTYCVIGRTVNNEGWLLRIGNDGSVLSSKSYGGLLLKDIATMPDENALYMVGLNFSNSSVSYLKTDTDGNVIWQSDAYGPLSVVNLEQTKIIPYDSTSFMLLFGNDFDSYLVQSDTNGVASSFSLDAYIQATDITQLPDGSIALLGNGPIYGIRGGVTPIWDEHIGLIKTDTLLNVSNCAFQSSQSWFSSSQTVQTFTVNTAASTLSQHHLNFDYVTTNSLEIFGCVSAGGGINEQSEVFITAFPTVSYGQLSVVSEENTAVTLQITDEAGKVVFNSNLAYGQTELDLSHLGGGIYFCHYLTEDQRTSTQKIILINE